MMRVYVRAADTRMRVDRWTRASVAHVVNAEVMSWLLRRREGLADGRRWWLEDSVLVQFRPCIRVPSSAAACRTCMPCAPL
jgi:hypothetical protein